MSPQPTASLKVPLLLLVVLRVLGATPTCSQCRGLLSTKLKGSKMRTMSIDSRSGELALVCEGNHRAIDDQVDSPDLRVLDEVGSKCLILAPHRPRDRPHRDTAGSGGRLAFGTTREAREEVPRESRSVGDVRLHDAKPLRW